MTKEMTFKASDFKILIIATSCSLKNVEALLPQRLDCGVLLFSLRKFKKAQTFLCFVGFPDRFLTDISPSGVKGHLPKLYRYFDTLLHPAKTTRKLRECRSSHEHQRVQWNRVEENIMYVSYRGGIKRYRARDLRKQLLPVALGA